MTFPPPTKENEMQTINTQSLQELSQLIYAWHDDAETSVELIEYINKKSKIFPKIPVQEQEFEVGVTFKVYVHLDATLPGNARDMDYGKLEDALEDDLRPYLRTLEEIDGYPDVTIEEIEVMN